MRGDFDVYSGQDYPFDGSILAFSSPNNARYGDERGQVQIFEYASSNSLLSRWRNVGGSVGHGQGI